MVSRLSRLRAPFVLWFLFLVVYPALASPLKWEFGGDYKQFASMFKDPRMAAEPYQAQFDLGNEQITLMKTAIDGAKNHNAQSMEKVKLLFTERYNIQALERGVNRLATEGVHVIGIEGFGHKGKAVIMDLKKHGLEFGHGATDMPQWKRTFDLISTSTRALGMTTDCWVWVKEDRSLKKAFKTRNTVLKPDQTMDSMSCDRLSSNPAQDAPISGDPFNSKYSTLVSNVPEQLHLNAGTWALFGYYLKEGHFPPGVESLPGAPGSRRRTGSIGSAH